MPEEAKVSVYSGLQQLVLQLASHEGGGWHRLSAAGKRLCLTLAAAAVRSGSTAEDTTHPPTHHARTLPPYLPAIDRWHALFAVRGAHFRTDTGLVLPSWCCARPVFWRGVALARAA